MPNRILRDWTDSEKIDNLTVHAERFFTRLIMKADDFGRYSANLKYVKSTLFPLRTDVRETDITRWFAECEKAGLIALYTVASKDYVQIENFKQVLRQKNEKYPAPERVSEKCEADDKQMLSTRIADASLKRREVETEEKGKGLQADATHPPDLIDSFQKFNTWLKDNAPRVLELKHTITIEQFQKLKTAYPDMKVPAKTLKAMHNFKPLTRNYVDAYLTLKKWIAKDEAR